MRRFWSIISLVLVGCHAPDVQKGQPLLIGHGGSGFHPLTMRSSPNSKSSVLKGLSFRESNGVEVDVQISKNGSLYLYHDAQLESSTNATGEIKDHTDEELNAVMYKPDYFGNQDSLYSMKEFIQDAKTFQDAYIFLNVRAPNTHTDSMLNALGEAVSSAELQLAPKVFIESSNKEWLRKLGIKNPSLNLLLNGDYTESNIMWCANNGLKGMVVDLGQIDADLVNLSKELGLLTGIFNVILRKDFKKALEYNLDIWQVENIPLAADFASE